jgi:membrane-bound lytic murein transglycosylase B
MPKHRPRRKAKRGVLRTAAALAGGALVALPTLATGLTMPVVVSKSGSGSVPPHQAASLQLPNVAVPLVAENGHRLQPSLPVPLAVPSGRSGSAGISGPLGIPASMLKAYKNAAEILAKEHPGCHLDWALIASIGRIESNHARGGYVNAAGDTLEPILGPVLDGAGPFAAIPDTDSGKYDGDTLWDRAVGPMQFIPSTWRGYASDGNGDGVSNPNNIYDEALATARYLCSGGLDLSTDARQRIAVGRYNNSRSYVDSVTAWAAAYRSGVAQLPDSDVPIGTTSAPVSAAPARPARPAPPVDTPPPATSVPPSRGTPPSTTQTSTTPAGPTTDPTTTPSATTTSTTPAPTSTATTPPSPTTRPPSPTVQATTPDPSADAPTESGRAGSRPADLRLPVVLINLTASLPPLSPR